MKRSKWRCTTDLLAVALIAVLIYVAGFVIVRARYVALVKYPGGEVVYHSIPLMHHPDGVLGRLVDFYRPAFFLESKWHHKGSNQVVINGWAAGMRSWDGPF